MAKNPVSKMVNKFVNKLMKKFKFLTKKGNMNKVLFLALVLLALYMLHRFALGGFEGFKSEPSTFEEDISGEGKKLVLFYAEWCPHCKTLLKEGDKPWVQAENELNTDESKKLIHIDVGEQENEEHKALNEKYGISGFPTIVVFENGEKVEEYSGGRTKDDFIGFFSQ